MTQAALKIKPIIPDRLNDRGGHQVVNWQTGCDTLTNLGGGYPERESGEGVAVEGKRQRHLALARSGDDHKLE